MRSIDAYGGRQTRGARKRIKLSGNLAEISGITAAGDESRIPMD